MKRAHNFKDITNEKFNRLTVMELSHIKNNRAYWLCRCDCGKEVVVSGSKLRNGHTKSCGCYKSEVSALNRINSKGWKHSQKTRNKMSLDRTGGGNNNYRHGLCGTKKYNCLMSAKRRALKINQTPALTQQELNRIQSLYQISDYLGPDWEVDHIQPISKGGLHHPNNLQIVTKEYNLQKSDKINFRNPTTMEVFNI